MFSFAANFLIFGDSPVSFRIINIILNGVATWLSFRLVFELFRRKDLAILAALLFALFPVHTEVVAYIKSRDELLGTVFALSAWLLFLNGMSRHGQQARLGMAASSILVSLAVLSKETYIIAPFIFLIVYHIMKPQPLGKLVRLCLWYGIPILVYITIRFAVLGRYAFGADTLYFTNNPLPYLGFSIRVFTALKIFLLYVGKTLLPLGLFRLSATHYYNATPVITDPWSSPAMWGGVALLVLAVGLLFRPIFRASSAGVGIIAFLISYSIVSKFIFVHGDLMADRWMYFPSVGIALIAASLLLSLYQRKKFVALVFISLIVIFYGAMVIQRNTVWLSNELLFQSMIRDAPNSVQGYFGLANTYVNHDNQAQALLMIKKALTIYPGHPLLWDTLGVIYAKEKNYPVAEAAFRKAILLDPRLVQAYTNLARVYYAQEQYEYVEQTLRELLRADKLSVNDIVGYSLALTKMKRFDESLSILDRFAHRFVDQSSIRFAYAVNYFKLGKINNAQTYFDWTTSLSNEEKIKILETF